MSNRGRCVKGRENVPQLANVFRVHAARVVLLEKTFQSLVADGPYHLEA
jgi:hypothetical protein